MGSEGISGVTDITYLMFGRTFGGIRGLGEFEGKFESLNKNKKV